MCLGSFSALQRAEIAEMNIVNFLLNTLAGFSALQRAEIAEILQSKSRPTTPPGVSVLFNEPKLLKLYVGAPSSDARLRFSALQRAEIAEILLRSLMSTTYGAVSVLFNEPKLLKFCGTPVLLPC